MTPVSRRASRIESNARDRMDRAGARILISSHERSVIREEGIPSLWCSWSTRDDSSRLSSATAMWLIKKKRKHQRTWTDQCQDNYFSLSFSLSLSEGGSRWIFGTRCTTRERVWITRRALLVARRRRAAEVEDFRSPRLESIMHRCEGKSCVNELAWTSESRRFFASPASRASSRAVCSDNNAERRAVREFATSPRHERESNRETPRREATSPSR